MIRPHDNPQCKECGDELKKHEQASGICWTCSELENNRRYRLAHRLGEYAPDQGELNDHHHKELEQTRPTTL